MNCNYVYCDLLTTDKLHSVNHLKLQLYYDLYYELWIVITALLDYIACASGMLHARIKPKLK